MEPLAFFLASLAGMLFGTLALAGYLTVFYNIGRHLGSRLPPNRPMWKGIALIGAFWTLPSLWPLLLEWNVFIQAGIVMAFFILNAYPMAVGYGIAAEQRKVQSVRRFRKNVDDWLGEWECEALPHGHDGTNEA